jgi:hypothetical protein
MSMKIYSKYPGRNSKLARGETGKWDLLLAHQLFLLFLLQHFLS